MFVVPFREFVLGKDMNDMQVGCLWQGDYLLTVSLSGFINYLDVNNPTTPLRIIKVSYIIGVQLSIFPKEWLSIICIITSQP